MCLKKKLRIENQEVTSHLTSNFVGADVQVSSLDGKGNVVWRIRRQTEDIVAKNGFFRLDVIADSAAGGAGNLESRRYFSGQGGPKTKPKPKFEPTGSNWVAQRASQKLGGSLFGH